MEPTDSPLKGLNFLSLGLALARPMPSPLPSPGDCRGFFQIFPGLWEVFPDGSRGAIRALLLSSHSISYMHLSFRFFKYVLPTRLEACRTQVHGTLESECPQGLLRGPPFGGH